MCDIIETNKAVAEALLLCLCETSSRCFYKQTKPSKHKDMFVFFVFLLELH